MTQAKELIANTYGCYNEGWIKDSYWSGKRIQGGSKLEATRGIVEGKVQKFLSKFDFNRKLRFYCHVGKSIQILTVIAVSQMNALQTHFSM